MEIETKIKEKFKNKYVWRRDCGIEYFEGDYHEMMDDMYDITKKVNTYRKDEYKKVINKKTLNDFVDETLIYDQNKTDTGVESHIIHNYYTEVWLKNNNVDIPIHNIREFIFKISKIIGRPVKDIFLERFFINDTSSIINKMDFYKEYIEKKLLQSNNNDNRLKQSIIISDFKLWMELNHKNETFKTSILTENINKAFGNLKSMRYINSKYPAPGWGNIIFQ